MACRNCVESSLFMAEVMRFLFCSSLQPLALFVCSATVLCSWKPFLVGCLWFARTVIDPFELDCLVHLFIVSAWPTSCTYQKHGGGKKLPLLGPCAETTLKKVLKKFYAAVLNFECEILILGARVAPLRGAPCGDVSRNPPPPRSRVRRATLLQSLVSELFI